MKATSDWLTVLILKIKQENSNWEIERLKNIMLNYQLMILKTEERLTFILDKELLILQLKFKEL